MSTSGATHRRRTVQHTGYRRFARRCARVFATGLGLALLLVCGSAWAGKYNPVVGIAKQASLVRANNDGTYAVDFELRIQNSGREALIDVQILDELSRWIKPATVVGVSAVRVRGALSELRPGFDGVTENYLLSGNEELQPGEEAFVNFTLTFDANGQPGPFKNKAMAWVEGKKSGKEKDDFSQNGTDPDPDTPSERPEDNPNPDDHDDPTPFELPNDPSTDLKPAIGVAKRAEPTRALAAGEFPNIDTGAGLADPASVYPFVTTITLTIANVGDAPLIDVQLRDDLMLTFADAASFAVLGALSSTGPLTVNPGFDGLGDTALLAGTDALPVGGSGTVQFAVAFDPGSAPGPFFNVANGQAVPDLPPGTTGPTDPVDDDSDDGSDPDPDGDGDPSESGENDPTPIDVPAEGPAVIGLAKAARDVAALADGEFAVTIELTVENLGASLLQDVQVTDDLRDTFSAARSFRILEAPTATGGLPVNAGYDGASNIALLAPGARLAVGEQQRIRYRAAFDPGAAPGPFLNIAFAQGTSPGGEDTDDQSTDGDDPDPDGNGDPGDNGEDQPTPISTTESVQIGIAKQAGAVEAGATNGEFEVTFLLTVENLSNVPLLDVQVRDSLATTFAAASSWRLLQAPTATGNLPLNPGFNGDTDDALLVADSAVLQVGQSEQIELQVAFTPSESGQVFENIAVANGVSPLGTPTEDRSTDGLNPDPNGNGDPEEENPTVVGPPTGPSGPGALVGTVFLDRNHDDLLGEGEQPLSGWRVVLRDAAGTVVGETVTDASGNYRFDDLPAGDYTVSFLHPDTGVTWGQPAVTIEENETARVDLPVDPQGRIYDSLTRDLVPGASVRILNANNDAELPPSCLLPGQQDQIVGSDAMYRFDIIHGADSRCPSARTPYRIEVVAAPEPFIIAPSTRIPPQSTTLDALVCSVDTDSSAPCVVLPGTDAPTEGEPTGYFLTIAIAASDPTVVNNHIPLDRPIGDALASDLVTMQKRALTSTASVGDLVFFEVRLQNQTLGDLTDVSLRDDLPGGFALVPESVLLIDPGADGQVDTGDDAQTSVGIAGTDPVTFGPFTLPASATRILRYGLRVSAGVTEGAFINRITPLQAGKVIGADAQALVEIVSDAVFDNTTIIGKVFDDRDGDGWQDPAHATGLVVSGGPFDTPLTLPDLRGRRADSDPPALLRLDLPTGTWAQPIMLQSREGSRLTFTEDGTNANAPTGVLGRGQSGQQLALRIEQRDGARALVIENMGVVERGIPGVRLGTVAGLLIEADYRGRFHLADVATGSRNRGTNFILKLDTASLPDGSRLISENPRVLRLTTALMSRIDFAVQLPRGATVEQTSAPGEVLELVTRRQRAQLPPVNFDTGRVDIPGSYAESLRALLAQYSERDNLRMTFVGHADPRGLRGRLRSRYGDNKGLSAARAAEVAQFARSALDVPDSMIGFEGRGATQPVAPNDGPLGWAANRRVEIELSWTEVKQQQFAVTDAATAPTIGTTEVPRDSVRDLPQLHYRSGIAQLDDALISTARRLLAEAGDTPVRLKLTAHTDSQGLSAAARQRFGDNQGLSQARADAAAAQLRDILQLPAAAVVAEGRGASQPIGDNATATGRAANRRLELQLTTRATEQLERRWITPLQESRTDYLANGGAIWATEQPLIVTPKLDVLASVDRWSEGDAVPVFNTYLNYGLFIDRLELRFYAGTDLDRVRPLATLPVPLESGTASLPDQTWQQLRTLAADRSGNELQYVLRAYGASQFAAGNDDSARETFDETAPRLLQLRQRGASQRARSATASRSVWGQSNLAMQRVATNGSLVRVMGIDVDPRMTLTVEGQPTPVAADGSFVWEQQRPVGQHTLLVDLMDTDGRHHERKVAIDVDGNYQFAVALANLTVGQNDLKGSLEPLSVDDHFDEEVFVDGRIALYAKAKIRGRYLLTAQLDSTEDELRNFGDNLKRKDPRRLFRQLDPDRYYTVYGDDSTTVSDVDTQGAFYVRLDFDRSSVLWGNFNTDMVDTEFTQFNRSLYGAKVQLRSTETTAFGDAKRALTLFGSEAQSAAAHVTFAATGGSLYYLKHTGIVEGSEKVWIEVRRRDSEVVLDRQVLIEGRDYEVDALQGRIILARPLSQVVNDRGPGIIRSAPLEGDNVFLLADYEYLPEQFAADELTAGGRGSLWLGDHVGVGVSKVVDQRAGTDYDLEGADITLRAGRGTYVRAEFARSEAQQNLANFSSVDGGLSFQSANGAGPGSDGQALALEARVNLAEVTDNQQGDVRIWWKDRDADFSAGRLNNGTATKDRGLDLFWSPSDSLRLSAGYNELDRDDQGSDTVARVQLDTEVGRWQAGVEARYEEIERGGLVLPSLIDQPLANPPLLGGTSSLSGRSGNGEALLLGGRLGYQVNTATQLYAAAQTVADDRGEYEDNDLFSLGVNTTLNERLGLGLEVSDGDRGSAVMGAIDVTAASGLRLNLASGFGSGAVSQFSTRYSYGEGHELYGSYAVDPDRTEGPRDMLTFGQRRQFGNHTRIFTETQFGKDDRYASTGHLFGLDYSGIQDWLLTATVQQSDNERLGFDFERLALSVGARLERNDYKVSSRLEYREDDADAFNTRSYLTSNSITWHASEASRWLALFNMSWTDDEVFGGKDARFIEFDLGHAYRPIWNNRLNVLAKYSYLFDLPSEGQTSGRADQRAHLFSAEALYDLTNRWELGAKVGFKRGEERFMRDGGEWLDFGVRMAAIRARYHMLRRWDAVVEYRWVADWLRDTEQQGALLGVYRHLGDHLKVGVGYNFAGFDDDLKREDYDSHGWFIDLVGKY